MSRFATPEGCPNEDQFVADLWHCQQFPNTWAAQFGHPQLASLAAVMAAILVLSGKQSNSHKRVCTAAPDSSWWVVFTTDYGITGWFDRSSSLGWAHWKDRRCRNQQTRFIMIPKTGPKKVVKTRLRLKGPWQYLAWRRSQKRWMEKKVPLTSQVAVCIMNQKVDAISVVAQWHIPPHTRWNSDPQSAGSTSAVAVTKCTTENRIWMNFCLQSLPTVNSHQSKNISTERQDPGEHVAHLCQSTMLFGIVWMLLLWHCWQGCLFLRLFALLADRFLFLCISQMPEMHPRPFFGGFWHPQ